MNKRQTTKEVFLVLTSFLTGSLVMLGITTALFYTSNPSQIETPGTSKTQIIEKNSLAESIAKIMDATVVIQGYVGGEQKSTGSGFFYKTDEQYGYILTNEHILRDKDAAKVFLSTDEELSAEILGKDEFLDLAVLRVPKKYVLLVATTGSSENANIGDTIYTVGAPMGYEYRGTVTSGILSGKDRLVSLSTEEIGSWQMRVLQIDAPINPGSSGGPLLNINGEVIGICTMKLIDTQVEGMGFAIPIEYALSHVQSLEKKEQIKWPVLGIEMINASDSTALVRNELHIPETIKKGVVVTNVKENGAATKVLQRGDVITKVNDDTIKNVAHFKYVVYQHQSGEKIQITYIRNNKEHKETITLQ